MAAGLVALAADVELQRDERAALQGAIVLGQGFFKAIHGAPNIKGGREMETP
jgi:hypothetical protein